MLYDLTVLWSVPYKTGFGIAAGMPIIDIEGRLMVKNPNKGSRIVGVIKIVEFIPDDGIIVIVAELLEEELQRFKQELGGIELQVFREAPPVDSLKDLTYKESGTRFSRLAKGGRAEKRRRRNQQRKKFGSLNPLPSDLEIEEVETTYKWEDK